MTIIRRYDATDRMVVATGSRAELEWLSDTVEEGAGDSQDDKPLFSYEV